MASITIRNLEDPLKTRLRIRAAHHAHSMEEEARYILRAALMKEQPYTQKLGQAIRQRFAPLGGVELPERAQDALRAPPDFE